MSDEQRPTDAPRPPKNADGIHEHWCEHPGCKKWGGWGFARGRDTVWFCFEHRERDGQDHA